MRQDLLGRSLGDDLPAVLAGSRTQVHDPVRFADGFVVMFDDQNGVAQIAQTFERFQQPCVIAWMQPDGWLIQHIQHADQPRANLGCQPDALCLAAR